MAILGTFVDRATISRAGDDLNGTTVGTLAHSLPATNAELFVPVMQSLQGGIQGRNFMSLLGVGSNASILTIGYSSGSITTASCPTVSFVVLAGVLHSIIR